MSREKLKSLPVSTGAEAFLAHVRALGAVRYLFANTGTDHGPIIEALAKTATEDPNDLQPIVVPHELAAVSMAHGYYNVTQKPQMVLVHTLPGTANALGGIINAQSANVPVLLVAGRTPITEGELRGESSLSAVERGVGAPKQLVCMAVGWLAREGKVALRQEKRSLQLCLTDGEQNSRMQ